MTKSGEQYRALYLLHGFTGDDMYWSTRTDPARIARGLPLVIVMPDGENAWCSAADEGLPECQGALTIPGAAP